jgi:hypothetical protein
MMTERVVQYVIISVLVLILSGCASKAVPEWQRAGFNHLERFKKAFLSGDHKQAARSYDDAIMEIKKSGRMDILAKAYLTRCAVAVAAREEVSCDDYLQIRGLLEDEDNETDAYHAFITGEVNEVDERLLPEEYRPFLHAVTAGSIAEINKSIRTMRSSLSRLIAVGLTLNRGTYDDTTISIAIDTASHYGWKTTLIRYLEALQSLYERNGDMLRAEKVQERIHAMSLKK